MNHTKTRTPEECHKIASDYLASDEYIKAWAALENALETWKWRVCKHETDYLMVEFSCSPYPATFKHYVDLGISREKFDKGVPEWCALELVNGVILGLNWLTWWKDHQDGQNPTRRGSLPSPFRDTLAVAIHNEARPKVMAHPNFQRGMNDLFDLATSKEIYNESRRQLIGSAENHLYSAVLAMRTAGYKDEDIRGYLERALNGALSLHKAKIDILDTEDPDVIYAKTEAILAKYEKKDQV